MFVILLLLPFFTFCFMNLYCITCDQGRLNLFFHPLNRLFFISIQIIFYIFVKCSTPIPSSHGIKYLNIKNVNIIKLSNIYLNIKNINICSQRRNSYQEIKKVSNESLYFYDLLHFWIKYKIEC